MGVKEWGRKPHSTLFLPAQILKEREVCPFLLSFLANINTEAHIHTYTHTYKKNVQMYKHRGNYIHKWLDGITLLAWTVLLAEPAVSHRAFDVITVADWWLCGTDHKFRRLPQPQCDASTSVCTSNTSRSGCTAQFWWGVAGRDRRRDQTWRVQAVPMILVGCNIDRVYFRNVIDLVHV